MSANLLNNKTMKKYILSIAVVTTAAIAGWNYQQNQQRMELSDLALENIEALASGELPPNCRAVWNKTCCVVGSTHHTYCEASGSGASTRSCSHSY